MKGVSAVIAIILILMIVVALAALAYTWFTGIFTSLTATTGESVTQTTEQMAKKFSIDAASCTGGTLQFTIRNTGTGALNSTLVSAFLDGVTVTDLALVGGGPSISPGGTQTYSGSTPACAADQVLRVTIETGLGMTTVLT
jgi:FlaG/FlaF family flagellin (archaellin)